MKLTILVSIIILLALASCESTVQNFELKETSNKLVLNSFPENKGFPQIFISRNMDYLEKEALYPQLDALVELYENDKLISTLQPNDENWYTDTTISLETGKKYTYVVSKVNFPDAEASFSIPEDINIVSIDTQLVNIIDPDCMGCSPTNFLRYKIAFENSPEIAEYFSIEVTNYRVEKWGDPMDPESKQDSSVYNNKMYMNSSSPLIETIESYSDYYYSASATESSSGTKFYVSDKYSNNNIDTIIIDANLDIWNGAEINISTLKIKSVENTMFKYVNSRGIGDDAEDNPFLEPASIYSNVENGLGIVAGFNTYSVSFDVSHYSGSIVEEEYYY